MAKKINYPIHRAERHMWTKDEIKQVIKLWTTTPTTAMAEKLGLTKLQVSYIANQIRKSGFKLPRKMIKGRTRSLIDEVVNEL